MQTTIATNKRSFSNVAEALTKELKALNIDIKHSNSLQMLARITGYKNYQTYKSLNLDGKVIFDRKKVCSSNLIDIYLTKEFGYLFRNTMIDKVNGNEIYFSLEQNIIIVVEKEIHYPASETSDQEEIEKKEKDIKNYKIIEFSINMTQEDISKSIEKNFAGDLFNSWVLKSKLPYVINIAKNGFYFNNDVGFNCSSQEIYSFLKYNNNLLQRKPIEEYIKKDFNILEDEGIVKNVFPTSYQYTVKINNRFAFALLSKELNLEYIRVKDVLKTNKSEQDIYTITFNSGCIIKENTSSEILKKLKYKELAYFLENVQLIGN